jgi:hypothetical protein
MTGITFEDEFFRLLDSGIRQQKRLADRAMVEFIVLRLSLVVASASLPALIMIAGKEWSSGVAVLVAPLTGLDTQFRWGEEWRHFRSTQITLERMKRDYDHRKAALNGGRSIGNITTKAENFDKLYSDVEDFRQTQADSFFKFRVTEWQQPHGRPT